MGHATKMFYIDHMIIQIHIYIVAVRLKGFHLTVTQDMLQSIPSSGTGGVRSRNNVNDFRMAAEREIAFVDFPVRRLIADNLVIMLHQPAYLLVGIFTETFDDDGTCGSRPISLL